MTQKVMGVVRKTAEGWSALNDSGHEPVNVLGFSCLTNGDLQIDHTPFTKIHTAFVVADETFSRAGYVAGISVGLDNSKIRFTRYTSSGPIAVSCSSSVFETNNGNFWLYIEGIV